MSSAGPQGFGGRASFGTLDEAIGYAKRRLAMVGDVVMITTVAGGTRI